MSEIHDLLELGADDVIPEEFETSIEIFSRVLKEYGTPRHVIHRRVGEVRNEGYQMLRSPSLALVEVSDIADALGGAATEMLLVEEGSPAVGKTIGELKLRSQTGVTVIAAVREGQTEINPGPQLRIQAEDVLVLLGAREQLDGAMEYINA
jgi:CPA2 family monovalent cation:H+ antiporter-2